MVAERPNRARGGSGGSLARSMGGLPRDTGQRADRSARRDVRRNRTRAALAGWITPQGRGLASPPSLAVRSGGSGGDHRDGLHACSGDRSSTTPPTGSPPATCGAHSVRLTTWPGETSAMSTAQTGSGHAARDQRGAGPNRLHHVSLRSVGGVPLSGRPSDGVAGAWARSRWSSVRRCCFRSIAWRRQLGRDARSSRALCSLEASVLWPVVAIWGHPEDPLAMTFALYGFLAAFSGRWRSCGWWWGLALVMQPLVVLCCP